MDRYSDAKQCIEEAIAIRRAKLGDEHPYTIGSLEGLEIINRRIVEQGGEEK